MGTTTRTRHRRTRRSEGRAQLLDAAPRRGRGHAPHHGAPPRGRERHHLRHPRREDGKKRRNTRGASETHASLDRAKVAMEKLAATAVKAGWVKKERAGGFARKPDSFDAAHLPAPGKKGGR